LDVPNDEGQVHQFPVRDLAQAGVIDKMMLNDCIADLAPGYRKHWLLHEIDGYTHEEVSRILGCSIGCCKSQLRRARMSLRERVICASKLSERPYNKN